LDLNEYLDVDFIREIRQWPKILIKKPLVTESGTDLIEKKRAKKRWKQSNGYYWLHPENFRFGLKDIK